MRMKPWLLALLGLWLLVPALAWGAPLPIDSASPQASAATSSEVQAPVRHMASASPLSPGAPAMEGAAQDTFVRLDERKVFAIRVPRGAQSVKERADAASLVLLQVLDVGGPAEVHLDTSNPEQVLILVGARTVVTVTPDDAKAAHVATVSELATEWSEQVKVALAREQARRQLSRGVISISFVVFFALVALLVVRKLTELIERARGWLFEEDRALPGLKVRGIEVVSAASVRGGAAVLIVAARFIAQFGVGYTWLLFALSLFDLTRPLGARLTGVLFAPISSLLARVVATVPLAVLLGIAGLVVTLVVRFLGLFFESVSRGETRLSWLPPDLAAPVSLLARLGVIVLMVILGIPFATGQSEGALAYLAIVSFATLGLALVPLASAMVIGGVQLFGRRVRVGDMVEIGGSSGRVSHINLLELQLEDPYGAEVRIPHLLVLLGRTRILSRFAPVIIELTCDCDGTSTEVERIRERLTSTASTLGVASNTELLAFDGAAASFRVRVATESRDSRARAWPALAQALRQEGVIVRAAKIDEGPLSPLDLPRPSVVLPWMTRASQPGAARASQPGASKRGRNSLTPPPPMVVTPVPPPGAVEPASRPPSPESPGRS